MGSIRKFICRHSNSFKFKLTPSSYLLITIFLIASFLRLLGVYPGFPPNHPDEPTVYGSVSRIIVHGDFKPVLYSYGGLLPKLYAFFVAIFFIPSVFLKEFIFNFGYMSDHGFFPFVDNFRHSQLLSGQNFLYWTRYLTAVLGALTVIVTYKLGKNLFDKWTGVLAAFLVAINYRLVLSSVFALADVPAAFFAAFSVLLSFNLIRQKSLASYVWAGMGLALALSVKFFIYVIPAFFLCHIFAVFQTDKSSFFKKMKLLFVNKNLTIALVSCIALFFVINSYIAFDFHAFLEEYQYDSKRFGMTSPLSNLLSYNYHKSLLPLYYLMKYSLGGPLIIAIIIGFLYSLVRKFKSTLILSSVILPFIMVFLIIAVPSSPRYYSAIVPLLLLFPSFLIIDISRIIHARHLRLLLIALLIFPVGFKSLKDSYLTSQYFSSEQNQVASLRWLEENLPNDSLVAVSAAGLPLRKNIREIDVSPVGPTHLMAMEELIDNEIEWVVVSSHFTSNVNNLIWHSSMIEKTFFNDNLFWELISNTYTSLVLQDIGRYRIKEFVKPFWQSPDRAIFIARVPKFWQTREDISVVYYGFDRMEDRELFSKISHGKGEEPVSFSADTGYDNLGSLYLETEDCPIETKLSSKSFSIDPGKWYSIIGFVKRENNRIDSAFKDGFLRLDFYSDNNKIIKTYVSSLLDLGNDWQKLTAAGISPALARHGRISFQLDKCFLSEKYFIDDLQVFLSDDTPKIDKGEFPFYEKELPKNFLWLPEL